VEGAGNSAEAQDVEVCAQWVLEEDPDTRREVVSSSNETTIRYRPEEVACSTLFGIHCRIDAPPAPATPLEFFPLSVGVDTKSSASTEAFGEDTHESKVHSKALDRAEADALAAAASTRADLEESLAPDGSLTTAAGPSCIGVRGGSWRLEACSIRAGRRADALRIGKRSLVSICNGGSREAKILLYRRIEMAT
jgi:hypothetical protein